MSFARSGLVSFMNRASIALFGFVNFYILIRILSKQDFGVWILFISVAAIMESVRKAFIYNPFVKFLNSSKEEAHEEVISSSLLLNCITAVLAISFLWLGGFFLAQVWEDPRLYEVFKIYSLGQFFYTFVIHYNSLNEANLKFHATLFSGMSQRIVFLLLVLYFHGIGYDLTLDFLAICHVVGIGIAASVSIAFGLKYHRFRLVFRQSLLEQFHYGKFTFGTNVSSMLFKNTDSWMLGSIVGKMAVASYNPAIRISNLFEVPLGAISSVVYPDMVRRIKSGGLSQAKILYEKSVGLSLAVMVPFIIAVVFFAEPIMILVAGEKYADSSAILQVTMIYGLIVPFNRQFGITMNAIGKAKINFIVLASNTLINVLLNMILIHAYGVIGAAYATLVSYFLILIVCEILLYRTLGVELRNIARSYFSSYGLILNMVRKKLNNLFV